MSSPKRSTTLLVFGALLATLFVVLVAVSRTSHVPYVDAGGYENMLRYFLQSGRVDYMRWSQPTFIGILPVAVPWSLAFGTSTASLQSLGIAYGLVLIGGLYLFLTRHIPPLYAALFCIALIFSSEFLPFVPTFMTDIPYATYLVWFLVVHQQLERAYNERRTERVAGLWVAWGLLFLFASLTRSFSLLLVILFLAQAVWQRSSANAAFPRMCFIVSAALSVAALATVRLIGINGFSLMELTVIPDVLLRHQWKRFDLRTLAVSLLQTALMMLPVLLVSKQAIVRRFRLPEIIVGVVGFVLALYFWKRGFLEANMTLPFLPTKTLSLLLVVLVPVAAVLLYRLLEAATTHSGSNTVQVLVALAAAHLFVLPVMQHPMLRHTLPAFIALLMLTAIFGVRSSRVLVAASAIVLVSLALRNTVSLVQQRTVEQAKWNMATDLVNSGVAFDQIDGGWAWYCYYHLRPGSGHPLDFVTDYHILTTRARFAIVDGAPRQVTLVRSVKVHPIGATTRISVIDRHSSVGSDREMPAP